MELAVIIALLVVVLFVRERDHQNALNQAHDLASAERSAMAVEAAHERVEHRALTERLLQRVQAPEQAVVDHSASQVVTFPVVRAVEMDDDAAHWESRLSKDELADVLMAQEKGA